VDIGSGDRAITRLALANRLANVAPTSLSNMLNRGSMMSSSPVVLRAAGLNEHQMPTTRSL
jgi:hypothetical protein